MSNRERLQSLVAQYRDGLLEDVLPFWLPRCVDNEHGGYLTFRDRDGGLLDTDKSVWAQGRFAWLLATLYNTVEPREEWLAAARSGIDFLEQHCADADGRLFFHLTRDGRPLRKRRYAYSEAFAAMAHAAYARAAADERSAQRARELYARFLDWNFTPDRMPAKFTDVRPTIGIGPRMIALSVGQTLRDTVGDPSAAEWIDRSIAEIRRWFVKPELEVVMEMVAPDGAVLDHVDGRTLNPGHAIEAAWFILAEANHRGGDRELIELGCSMLDWMWRRGWDAEFGGLFYFRDVYDRPVQEYWHDMKFWWPHNETIIATLLAEQLTGDQKYADWHAQVNDWAHRRFADPVHGEWFGYLHRDGTLAQTAKGNLWKGPFHLPRMQLVCWQTAAEMLAACVGEE